MPSPGNVPKSGALLVHEGKLTRSRTAAICLSVACVCLATPTTNAQAVLLPSAILPNVGQGDGTFLVPVSVESGSGAAGVVVHGYVWPSSTPTIGRPEEPVASAQAVTDAHGDTDLVFVMTPSLAAVAASDDGVLNVDVTATGSAGTGTLSVPRAVSASALSSFHLAPKQIGRAAAANDLAHRYPQAARAKIRLTPRLASATSPDDPGKPVCARTLISRALGVPTRAMDLHANSFITATFTYGTSADSEIDVGVGNSSSGPFSVNGSFHVGNTRTQTAHASTSDRTAYAVEIQVEEDKWVYSIACGISNPYRVIPSAWDGGLYTAGPVALGEYCTGTGSFFSSPGGYAKSTGTDTKFSGALNAFGFSAGASSGYSSNADISFNIPAGHTDYTFELCGHDGKSLSETGTVYAIANSTSGGHGEK
jgi:hypothetical protein